MEVARPFKRARTVARANRIAAGYARWIRRKIAGSVKYKTGVWKGRGRRMTPWRSKQQIMNVIKSSKESKFTIVAPTRATLYHNGGTNGIAGAFLHLLNQEAYMPVQGDTEYSRDGNDIYSLGFSLKMMVNIPTDRLNTKIRCMIFKVVKGYNINSYATVFDNVTGSIALDSVDTDRIQILQSWWIQPGKSLNPGVSTTGKELTYNVKKWIPWKRVIKFYDDGVQTNNQEWDLYIGCWAYDTYGALNTDICAYAQPWLKFYFKDN